MPGLEQKQNPALSEAVTPQLSQAPVGSVKSNETREQRKGEKPWQNTLKT